MVLSVLLVYKYLRLLYFCVAFLQKRVGTAPFWRGGPQFDVVWVLFM